MPKNKENVLMVKKVFIASPGDLMAERRIFRDVIDKVNKTKAKPKGILLEAVGWEDTLPGKGRPQELINKDIVECDLMVMLLWKRWGSSTGKYSSGFEEEFELGREHDKDIWFHFRDVPDNILADPGEQLRKVLDFRDKIEKRKEYLYRRYANEIEWKEMFEVDLSLWLDRSFKPVSASFKIPVEYEQKKGASFILESEEKEQTVPKVSGSTAGIGIGPRTICARSDKTGARDSLGRRMYAEGLARLIAFEATETPLCIGLFAPWGCGKTTLMDLVTEEVEKLKERNSDQYKDTFCLRFNAWEYDDQEKVWAGLLKSMIGKYEEEKGWLTVRWRYAIHRLTGPYEKWKKALFLLWAGLASVILACVLVAYFYSTWIDLYLAYVLAGGFGIGLSPAAPFLLKLFHPFGKSFNRYFRMPSYDQHLGFRLEIQRDLDFVLDHWLGKAKPSANSSNEPRRKRRLLLLIDDLDRCAPAKIVSILQALHLFLCKDGVVAILGADQLPVAMAIAKEYEHHFEANPDGRQKLNFGRDYLNKIVQIPFYIPKPTDLGNYLNELVGPELDTDEHLTRSEQSSTTSPAGDRLPKTATAEDSLERSKDEVITFSIEDRKAFREQSLYLESNPRLLKRLTNIYRLCKYFMSQWAVNDQSWNNYDARVLLKWLNLCLRWPQYAAKILSEFEGAGPFMENLVSGVFDEEFKEYRGKATSPVLFFETFLDQEPLLRFDDVRRYRSLSDLFFLCIRDADAITKKQQP